MKLLDVVLNSIARRKRRTFLIMLGITFAVAILISVTGVTLTYSGVVKSSFQPYSGKIAVVHSSTRFFEAMPSQSILVPEIEVELEAIEDVERIAPLAMRTYEGSDSLIPSILVGIRKTDHFFAYPELFLYPGGAWAENPGEVVVGSASEYYLNGSRTGDTISLYGLDLTITGVLIPTEIRIYNTYLMVDLEYYYTLTRSRFVSLFLIEADNMNSDTQDAISEKIEEQIPYVNALTDEKRLLLVSNIIVKVERWNTYVGLLAALMSVSLISTIQYLTTIQRQREFGTMKAIGASNSFMIRMILLENLVVGILGCLMGIFIGFLGAWGIVILYNSGQFGVSLSQTFELLSGRTMVADLFSGLMVAIGSTILPLTRVLKLDPVLSISNPEV